MSESPARDVAHYHALFTRALAGRHFLRVSDGCHVRVRDICLVSAGTASSEDGGETVGANIVVVHVINQAYVTLPECETPDEAAAMAGALVQVIEEAGG